MRLKTDFSSSILMPLKADLQVRYLCGNGTYTKQEALPIERKHQST